MSWEPARALAAGCNVVRMNMRSCGDGEEFSPTIYHAGRSEDVAIVMAELARTHISIRSFALVGIPWGATGSQLAGERGAAAPSYLKAVVGVSPSWIWPPPLPHCTNRRIAFTRAGFSAKSSSAFVARSNSARA